MQEHENLWKLIVSIGNAFAEIISIVKENKASDYKDKLSMKEIRKGELLWQGNQDFYIVRTTYKRQSNPKKKFRADVISLNNLKEETSFLVDYTIPIHDLLELEEFKTLKYKQYLLDFIDKNLMINFSL